MTDSSSEKDLVPQPVTNVDFSTPDNTLSLHPLQKLIPSMEESRNSGGTAGVLPEERAKATFDVKELTKLLDGGPKCTMKREWILSPSKGRDASGKYNMTRSELLQAHLTHFLSIHDPYTTSYVPTREEIGYMTENTMHSGTLMNHWGLFVSTILLQASDEQLSEWLPRAMMLQIIGSYAQTELGHGSNVRALRTTATYVPQQDCFIMETPTLQSIKWWPGTLGKVCTHALVYAQLLHDGKERGLQAFLVQVRDENHRPLPGVEVGDLGPKLGDGANDTGFLRLDKICVPRGNMLSKYQGVNDKGQWVVSQEKKEAGQLHYATMMFTRGAMVKTAGGMLAKAVTIASRYACVRKQGFEEPSKATSSKARELQIIDHQVHRLRVMKQLAAAYALKFTGKWLIEQFKELEGGEVGFAGGMTDLSNLSQIAATAAGLKGLTTVQAASGIEDLRKCCGGNGYLLASGIGALASDFVWQTTAEGDFIILLNQTARFLVKQFDHARQDGTELKGLMAHYSVLGDKTQSPANLRKKAFTLKGPSFSTFQDFSSNLKLLNELFQYRCTVEFSLAYAHLLEAREKHPDSLDIAWNQCTAELIAAAVSHCQQFMLETFIKSIEHSVSRHNVTEQVKKVLEKICALFATTHILDGNWLAASKSLGASQVELVRKATTHLLNELRPDIIALTDAFDIPDRVLNSAIGQYDGNVYEALFETVKLSDMNRMDPFEGYESIIRPRLDREMLEENAKIQLDLSKEVASLRGEKSLNLSAKL